MGLSVCRRRHGGDAQVVNVHHLGVPVATGFLLVCPIADGVGYAASLQVVECEPLIRRDDLVCECQSDKALPGRIKAGLAKGAAVAGHDDVPA